MVSTLSLVKSLMVTMLSRRLKPWVLHLVPPELESPLLNLVNYNLYNYIYDLLSSGLYSSFFTCAEELVHLPGSLLFFHSFGYCKTFKIEENPPNETVRSRSNLKKTFVGLRGKGSKNTKIIVV